METEIVKFLYKSYCGFKQKLQIHKKKALQNFIDKNWNQQRNATRHLLLDNEDLYYDCSIELKAHHEQLKAGILKFREAHFNIYPDYEFRSFTHLFLQRFYFTGLTDHFTFEDINQKRPVIERISLKNDIKEISSRILALSGLLNSLDENLFSGFVQKQFSNYIYTENTFIDIFPQIFFRNKHAYLLGELSVDGRQEFTFCVPFINDDLGIRADAFLTGEEKIKKIFEFTRSYLLVNSEDISGLISFLKKLMPSKPTDQLAINLGFLNLGKYLMQTRLYLHLNTTHEKISVAPGIKGMVMSVFTMPSYNGVIKIINDESRPPKETDKELVKQKYNLVALHDRAGRLADTQEFFNMMFFKDHFTPEAFKELKKETGENLIFESEQVFLIRHLYLERKMIPLNIFLKESERNAAEKAIIEYGNAIRDLAHINIFPGDLLLKNFGVTDGGRVVFYDYDEVCFVTDCNFRYIPLPSSFEEEFSGEKWFYCDSNDIFPEEFLKFLLWDDRHKEIFMKYHADLLSPLFWNAIKEDHLRGIVIDIAPYYS